MTARIPAAEYRKSEFTINLPWPSSALSSNARGHWRIKANANKVARSAAWALAREAKINKPMPDAMLVFTIYPPDNRRRDIQNMPHMLKAYIDGIADAMGCDDHGFEVDFPPRFAEAKKGGVVVCEVRPRTVILPIRGVIS